MGAISLKVNQKPVTVEVKPRTLLVELLREQLQRRARTWAVTPASAAPAR